MSGAVSRFGFVRGVGVSSMPDPRVNLTGDPYLTDGLRLVLFLNEPRRAFDQIEVLDWERVAALLVAASLPSAAQINLDMKGHPRKTSTACATHQFNIRHPNDTATRHRRR